MPATETPKRPARKRKAKKRPGKALAPLERQLEAWDRQPEESTPAFQAFAIYRDLGSGRSTAKVREQLQKNKRLIEGWSSRHAWVERAKAWDLELDRIQQAEQKEERVEASKRHAQIAQGFLQAVSAGAAEVLERASKDPDFWSHLERNDLLAFTVAGGRLVPRLEEAERIARGMGKFDEPAADVDERRERVRRMSDDDRTRYLLGELGDVVDLEAERERRGQRAAEGGSNG